MTQVLLVVIIGLLLMGASPSNRIILPWGYVEFDNNEVSIISTVEDPPGVRLAAAKGGSLGKVSFNVLRLDGKQEEIVLLQGKLDERYRNEQGNRAGEFTLHIRKPYERNDAGMTLVATMRHDGIIFHVPIYQERVR